MSPLGDLCRESGVEFQRYADDTQNWLSFIPGQVGSHDYCYQTLQQCVQKVKSWMSTNFLCLNTDKTEFIMFSTKPKLLKSPSFPDIELDGDQIHAVPVVRNLGFHMDLHLKNDKHINNVTSKCIFLIRKISAARNLLDMNTVCIIMQALVISRLDYCNSLLIGSTRYQLDKLQRVLNVAARVVKCLWKYDPIRVHLFELHWFMVPQGIEFKVLTLVFKCVNNLAPEYLQDFLVVSRNTTLQLANTKKIHMVKFRTQKLLNCSFTYAAVKLWNDLPISLRVCENYDAFKVKLKSHLFKHSYEELLH